MTSWRTSCWLRAQTEGVGLLGSDGLLSQVTKAVLERALGEEMTHHLGIPATQTHEWPCRNGGEPGNPGQCAEEERGAGHIA